MTKDDVVPAILMVLGYGGGAVLLAAAFLFDRRRIAGIRAGWAAKLDGRLDGWTVVFEVDGSEARLAFCDGWLPGRTFTAVRVDLRGRSPGWVRVRGSDDVRSKPPELGRTLFGGEWARSILDGVRRIGETRLEVSHDALTLRVSKCLRDERSVMALVHAVRVLCAHVCSHAPAGAVNVGDVSIGHGKCPVCQDEAEAQVVRCGKCRTPHHRDCWAFTGLCSMFACGSRRHA